MSTDKPPVKRSRKSYVALSEGLRDDSWRGDAPLLSIEENRCFDLSCHRALHQLLELVATVANVDHATICFSAGGYTRTISTVGNVARFRSTHRSYKAIPYRSDETVVNCDARESEGLQAILRPSDSLQFCYFLRLPVLVTADYVVALVLFDSKPRLKPDASEMRLITEAAEMIGGYVQNAAAGWAAQPMLPIFPVALNELLNEVFTSNLAIVLVDSNLRIVAASEAATALPESSLHSILEQPNSDLAPVVSGSLAFFLRRAISQGLTTPDLEVVIETNDGRTELWSVQASPICTVGSTALYLYITIRFLSGDQHVAGVAPLPAARASQRRGGGPTGDFLFDTLVQRRSVRARDGVNYMSLRSWRQPLKEFQVKALKGLKAYPGTEFPKQIGAEIAEEIISLLGTGAFDAVVPMSCGHSKGQQCLSVEIARGVGRSLNIPVVQAFARQYLAGSSHPKQNKNRPALRLVVPVEGSILLVDDIATSGMHLAEAATLLRPHCKMVLPMAWIGGEASDEE